jgi:membrane protease YdiL (CAAX protease family)
MNGLSNPIHVVLLIALLALWVVAAVLTARLAEHKGRSFAAYLLAALLIGWLIPLMAVLVLPRRKRTA